MDLGDATEPTPLVPRPSEPLRVFSGLHPGEACTSGLRVFSGTLGTDSWFGPCEYKLSRSLPVLSVRGRSWSPAPPTERSRSASLERCPQANGEGDGSPCPLHTAVWLADTRRIRSLLQAHVNVNATDQYGATPLMLAVELLPRAQAEYVAVLRLLLDSDADPRLRSSLGWSPLDEAVSRGDEQLVCTLFESTQRNLQQRWQTRLGSVAQSLALLPDFECAIRWEFESPVVPLVHMIAPSDVIRVRKRGTSLRLDSTLASWKRFRFSKRRELTTLFQGGGGGGSNTSTRGADQRSPTLCMVNHTKQTVADITEALDAQEAQAVLEDLVSASVMQWDMQVDSLHVAPATTWLGSAAGPCEINGWQTTKLDIQGELGVVVRKKGQLGNCKTFQEYFGCPLPPDACLPELRAEFRATSIGATPTGPESKASGYSECPEGVVAGEALRRRDDPGSVPSDADTTSNDSETLAVWPGSKAGPNHDSDTRDWRTTCLDDDSLLVDPASPGNGTLLDSAPRTKDETLPGKRGKSSPVLAREGPKDQIGKSRRNVSASVWLTTDFAIPMQQFLPILDVLSAQHEPIRRLKELFESKSFKTAAESAAESVKATKSTARGHVFPVKVSVPVNFALRGIVHFEAFQLKPSEALPQALFEVPAAYQAVPRREAQKTSARRKKRMLLSNLVL